MENIILVLPTGWNVKKIRYVQAPTGEGVYLLDADKIETPFDRVDSWFDLPMYPVKKNGPTGFRKITEEELKEATRWRRENFSGIADVEADHTKEWTKDFDGIEPPPV